MERIQDITIWTFGKRGNLNVFVMSTSISCREMYDIIVRDKENENES